MDKKKKCPCPNLDCPNHTYCDKCTSRHLRKGFLSFCSFYAFLPTIQKVIDDDPESQAAKKLDALIGRQLQAYEKCMDKHGLSQENQDKLLKAAAEYSDY
jgi:hypothetical protein